MRQKIKFVTYRGKKPDSYDNTGDERVVYVKEYLTYLWLIAFGVLFFVIGAALMYAETSDKRECTEPVSAAVIDVRVTKVRHRRRLTSTYSPVYQFEYEGNEYTVSSSSSSSQLYYRTGDTAHIYVDPDDPTHIYCPKDKAGVLIYVIFMALGGIVTAVFLLLMIKDIRDDKNLLNSEEN